jgi:hypothetical protein
MRSLGQGRNGITAQSRHSLSLGDRARVARPIEVGAVRGFV